MIHRALLILVLLLAGNAGFAQQKPGFIRRYINNLINDTTDISQPQFLLFPSIAYAPETSWEIGISALHVHYARHDTSNRLSEITGFAFYTLQGQYGFFIDHALYSHKSRWSYIGKLKYQEFPIRYHGIGPDAPKEYLAEVNAKQLNFRERVLRNLGGSFFGGLEADLQQLRSVRFEPSPTAGNVPLPEGGMGSGNLGIGLDLLYDKRHNVLNVRNGAFSELALIRYDKAWGSDYSFSQILSDTRVYKSINSRDVLAAQVFGQFTLGTAPFNQLSMMGGETIMRGYYTGRYRDKNQLAAQVEYRFLPLPLGFSKRLGATLFAASGAVFPEFRSLSFSDLRVAGGAGLRFLLFPKKDIFSRADLAFTRDGMGIYLFIGEAF